MEKILGNSEQSLEEKEESVALYRQVLFGDIKENSESQGRKATSGDIITELSNDLFGYKNNNVRQDDGSDIDEEDGNKQPSGTAKEFGGGGR